jgi:hypothetical protein
MIIKEAFRKISIPTTSGPTNSLIGQTVLITVSTRMITPIGQAQTIVTTLPTILNGLTRIIVNTQTLMTNTAVIGLLKTIVITPTTQTTQVTTLIILTIQVTGVHGLAKIKWQ